MKRVGIVCDNHKVKKFIEELEKRKFVATQEPWLKGTTLIKVLCNADRVFEIATVCSLLKINFKNQN